MSILSWQETGNYLNTCSQWHEGRSGHDLFFLFLFLKNLSLSSPFIPYQALPVLTFKFWFILNTIAHLANSFIPLSNKYLFCSPLVHINICSKSICGHMHMPHNIYVSQTQRLPPFPLMSLLASMLAFPQCCFSCFTPHNEYYYFFGMQSFLRRLFRRKSP